MFEIQHRELCGYQILDLRGEIPDPPAVKKVDKAMAKIIDSFKDHIALDLHMCDYINSNLIGFFLEWKHKLESQGRKFCLIEPSEKALEILTVCGIPQVIPVYKNEVEFEKNA